MCTDGRRGIIRWNSAGQENKRTGQVKAGEKSATDDCHWGRLRISKGQGRFMKKEVTDEWEVQDDIRRENVFQGMLTQFDEDADSALAVLRSNVKKGTVEEGRGTARSSISRLTP